MNSFGEGPLYFFVDDNEMFEDIGANYYWDNNYGKIVELSDVGCDAGFPLSSSSRDAKQRDRSRLRNCDYPHEHLRSTRCSRGDSQTPKNAPSRAGNYRKKRTSEEKFERRKNPLVQNVHEVGTDSIRRESGTKQRTRMKNNDDEYFVLEEVPFPPSHAPHHFMDIRNNFFAEEMHPPQRPTRTTRDRTNPKMSQTEGKRSKLKPDFVYERFKQKPSKLIKDPNLYKDDRDSVFLYEDYKEFKNRAVGEDSFSSLSKFSESSISSESSKEYSKDDFTLRVPERVQRIDHLNNFENRKKNKPVKNNGVKSTEKCTQNTNRKFNHVNESLKTKENYKYESNISNHSTAVNENARKNEPKETENPAQENKEQVSRKLKDLFNSYSVKKKTSLTKSSKQDSKLVLNSDDKKQEEDSREVKKGDLSIASSNSTISTAKRKRSRLPIRIGKSIKTKILDKNEKIRSNGKEEKSGKSESINITNSKTPSVELHVNETNDLNKNKVLSIDKNRSFLEPPELVSKSSENIIKKDTTSEGTMVDSKNSIEKNEQEEMHSRVNSSSKWQKVHFQRRAVDLKVFNMAKAAREQRKREFAEYGFEDIGKRSEEKPQEILDIGISLVEKNLAKELPQSYSSFDKSQSNIRDVSRSRVLDRRGSIYL